MEIQIRKLTQTLCVLTLVAMVRAAHKPLLCMRYKFDDSSMLEEDDFEEYSSGYLEPTAEGATLNSSQGGVILESESRPMKCAPDFNFCFTLWTQHANGTQRNISSQGCWKESTDHNVTCVQTECVASNRNDSLLYCCCSGDLCNRNISVAKPVITVDSSQSRAAAIHRADRRTEHQRASVIFYIVISSMFGLAFVSSIIYATSCYIRKRDKPEPEEAPLAPSGPGYSSNLRNVDNLKCLDIIGQGKYGVVYKGMIHDQVVAIKNFPEVHKQYYLNEREIYATPLMDSPALLTYFGYDERPTIDGNPQYLLLLSLAPLGCLQDWLIENILNFDTFCLMVKSITRGLSHLHTEMQRGDLYKPCIVHRDLNTRNILVNHDLSCCLADFGFALKVYGSKYEYKGEVALAETKSINEVGTVRYMAPELLEGAVNLRDCETSLKQMDVYALGLVLWEVATRCCDFYASSQTTPSYKAPYELEVGARPSFEQMQVLVARHKARPLFPAGWGGGAAEKLVKDTCEDCWDHDAEARLTSLCAEERMQEVEHLRPRALLLSQGTSPRLNTNNLAMEQQKGPQQQQSEQQQHPIQSAPNTSPTSCNSEAPATTVSPPPNQQILPPATLSSPGLSSTSAGSAQPEKNHLMHPQQQLQPYQGRNPCQERNLAPLCIRPPQVLVEKSKKHSFQSGQENSLSCLEDDVSVEELIAGNSKKFTALAQNGGSSMGQGFPKQQNTEKKLRGWHGVRALIQKKLFRKDGSAANVAYGDEKSNLVDNRYANAGNGTSHSAISPTKDTTVNFIGDKQRRRQRAVTIATETMTAAAPATAASAALVTASATTSPAPTPTSPEGLILSKRPNKLDLGASPSPLEMPTSPPTSSRSNLISKTFESVASDISEYRTPSTQSINTRISTPSRVVPRSLSTCLDPASNNNNSLLEQPFKSQSHLRPLKTASKPISAEKHFRRQRSLEVFNEVFSGRGSSEKLRNPSQRVKTPGDVPPSVRKVRASKTLSLYDDRMMDPTTLDIL